MIINTRKVLIVCFLSALSHTLHAQYASRLYHEQKFVSQRALAQTVGSKTETPFQDLNGMLNFASDFKGLSVIPTINVWATQKVSNSKGQVSFDAFIGISKPDSLLYNSGLKLFLPEASQYGFSFKGQHLIVKKDKDISSSKSSLFFNWQANVLGKTFSFTDPVTNDKSDESSMCFHPKLGLDLVVAKGLIDFYGNVNGLIRLTNVEKFDAFFTNKKDVSLFLDAGFGITANLEKGQDPKNIVYLQLGSIFKGMDANNFLKTKDLLVPVFKVTLLSKLSKIQSKTVTTSGTAGAKTLTF